MRTSKALARRRLDERLENLSGLIGPRPARGWVRAVREALGMSSAEMALRMGVTPSRISQIERGEADDSIHLSTLRRAAEALGCQLHYVLVPGSSLERMVRDQARKKATAVVGVATHTMRLEDQAPEPDVVDAQLGELIDRLVDSRGLWKVE